MSTPSPHHCPVCFAKGDVRCITVRKHMAQCPIHKTYHSFYTDCVRCHEAAKRAEREMRQAKDKENMEPKKFKPKPKAKDKPKYEMKLKDQRRSK